MHKHELRKQIRKYRDGQECKLYFVSYIALDKYIFTFDWNKQNTDQKQLMTHFPFRSFPWAFFCSDFSFSLLSTLPTQYVATAVRSLSSEAGVRTWDLSYLKKNRYKSCFCNFEFRNFKCLTKIHYTCIYCILGSIHSYTCCSSHKMDQIHVY